MIQFFKFVAPHRNDTHENTPNKCATCVRGVGKRKLKGTLAHHIKSNYVTILLRICSGWMWYQSAWTIRLARTHADRVTCVRISYYSRFPCKMIFLIGSFLTFLFTPARPGSLPFLSFRTISPRNVI